MEALKAPQPVVLVTYAGINITKDISEALLSVIYTDSIEGESDTIELVLEDVQGRWQGAWYPDHGDQLNVRLGYVDEALLGCGDFDVDEVQLSGPPDEVHMKGLAAGVQRSLRTRQGRAYEQTTLVDVAATIARRNKLKLVGNIEAVKLDRVNQIYETDLVFLSRLAQEYGYTFSVRGNQLVFMKRAQLKAAEPVVTLRREDVSRFNFRDKILEIAPSATVVYHDARVKRLNKSTVKDVSDNKNRQGTDELKLNIRAENDQQARVKAQAALEGANDDQTGASLTVFGNVRLVAGVNITLTDFGHMNGKYTITQARHSVSRAQGYTTEIECKRVRKGAGNE